MIHANQPTHPKGNTMTITRSLTAAAALAAAALLPVGAAAAGPLDPSGLEPFPDERYCTIRTVDTQEAITIEWPNFYFTVGHMAHVSGSSSGAGPLPCFPSACPAPFAMGSAGCYAEPTPFDDGDGIYYEAPVVPPAPAPLAVVARDIGADVLSIDFSGGQLLGAGSPAE